MNITAIAITAIICLTIIIICAIDSKKDSNKEVD